MYYVPCTLYIIHIHYIVYTIQRMMYITCIVPFYRAKRVVFLDDKVLWSSKAALVDPRTRL